MQEKTCKKNMQKKTCKKKYERKHARKNMQKETWEKNMKNMPNIKHVLSRKKNLGIINVKKQT